MRGNFTNDSFEFEQKPHSNDSKITPSVFATVTEILPRFRVNVLTTFGEIFLKVRTLGPFLYPDGKAHGRAYGIKKNQLVLIEFIGGSYRSPVVTKVFPFPTKDSDLLNLNEFSRKYSFLNPETDIIDFHESGYLTRQTTNKLELYDQDQTIILEIDFLNSKAKINLNDLEITANTKITGNLEVDGDIKSSGLIESEKDLISNKKSFNQHGHGYNPGPLPPSKTSPPI
ncbi:hypothetical protein LEP1GSC132_2490 [Leptospira kirschneri str. 200803703]|uniref:hypothetical protein n=1 Tax=Leptospira kirschneri TaxID=29507 RepID=UPI0002BE1634|nr:hypothetical protein [Leptospira kirschneri]EMO66419.1 hypothetical protein LEP1GSC132_2490 [Leptospira kirschneri str. 200803703]